MKKEDAIKKLQKEAGYRPPVELFYSEPKINYAEEIDALVMSAIAEVGINIDKAELVKALQYDRQQYEKGYADAKAEYKPAHTAWIYQTVKWRAGIPFAVCDACKQFGPVGVYCSNCGAFAGDEEGEADE